MGCGKKTLREADGLMYKDKLLRRTQ